MTRRDPEELLLNLRLDDHSEEDLKRVCLEVPCSVNLSFGNVCWWFEDQVRQKVQKSRRWRVYLDQERQLAFLQRRGAFLYDKYLAYTLPKLRKYNTKLIRHIVWIAFRQRQEDQDDDRASLLTLLDATPLSFSQASAYDSQLSINTPGSLIFEYDLDNVITSTQQDIEL